MFWWEEPNSNYRSIIFDIIIAMINDFYYKTKLSCQSQPFESTRCKNVTPFINNLVNVFRQPLVNLSLSWNFYIHQVGIYWEQRDIRYMSTYDDTVLLSILRTSELLGYTSVYVKAIHNSIASFFTRSLRWLVAMSHRLAYCQGNNGKKHVGLNINTAQTLYINYCCFGFPGQRCSYFCLAAVLYWRRLWPFSTKVKSLKSYSKISKLKICYFKHQPEKPLCKTQWHQLWNYLLDGFHLSGRLLG